MDVREQLVRDVRRSFAETQRSTGVAEPDHRVLDAMARVPREQFVPIAEARNAYDNRALAIGYGQTISQPFIVALMTTLLRVEPHHTVLEVGTGSGYQAAILAALVRRVFSIEIIPDLAVSARQRLRSLGVANVEIACRDGAAGWIEHAPFDGILVTAAGTQVPTALTEQLATGRRMILPVRGKGPHEKLVQVEKNADGTLRSKAVLNVSFVPLTSAPPR